MQRRKAIYFTAVPVFGAALSACQQSADPGGTAQSAQKQDAKTLAASLQTKTVAMIEAMNATNAARTSTAKTELEREANRVEEALKSETGPAANRVNAAVVRIKNAMIANDVKLLEQARDLLQQAQA
jgi:hypothetical protein